MATTRPKRGLDVDALSAAIAQGFDEVPWDQYNDRSLKKRMDTQLLIQTIQGDLMKVAAIDPVRAGRIWDQHVPDFVPRSDGLPEAEPKPEPTNAIEPSRKRRKAQAEPYLDPSVAISEKAAARPPIPAADVAAPVPDPSPQKPKAEPPSQTQPQRGPKEKAPAAQTLEAPEAPEDTKAARARMLLEGLERQYLKAEDKYHFRDRAREVAFEAQDKKLVTGHETPAVVTSMIDLAEASGWSSLRLTGTDAFRKEAWLQASLRDIEVTGYRPNKLDQVRLDELKAERGGTAPGGNSNVMHDVSNEKEAKPRTAGFQPLSPAEAHEPPLALTKPQDQFVAALEASMRARGDSSKAIAMARHEATERLRSDRVYVGKLVSVGTANYQDRPGEKMSHFVTLEDDKGQRSKVWGIDLPRAIETSGVVPGEKVALAFKDRKTVTVDTPVKDAEGKTIGTEKKAVDRNSWEAVGFDRLRDVAKARIVDAADRAHRPADLRVFDRSANRSQVPAVEPGRDRHRAKEPVR